MSLRTRLNEVMLEHHASEGLMAAVNMLFEDHVRKIQVDYAMGDEMHLAEMEDFEGYIDKTCHKNLLSGIVPFIKKKKMLGFPERAPDGAVRMHPTILKYSLLVIKDEADESAYRSPKETFGQEFNIKRDA